MASESRTRSVETRRPGQYGREVLRRSSLRWIAALAGLAALALRAPFVGAPTLGVIGFEIVLIGLMVAIDGKVTARLQQRLRGSRRRRRSGRFSTRWQRTDG